jgi:uncharacterized protein (UPF0333 family)
MIKKIYSPKGQISLEFSILMLAVITTTVILGYYMLKSAISIKKMYIDTINKSSNVTITALETVN